MPTKEEVLSRIQDIMYSGREVRHLITSISKSESQEEKISKVQKYDVFINNGLKKSRPFVVVKVIKGVSLCLGLSTTKNYMNLSEYKCRQFGDGYINFNLTLIDNDFIKINFVGIMSDKKGVNEAIKLVKFINNKI